MGTTDMEIEQAQANLIRKREMMGIKQQNTVTLKQSNEEGLKDIMERMLSYTQEREDEGDKSQCLLKKFFRNNDPTVGDYENAVKNCGCPSCTEKKEREAQIKEREAQRLQNQKDNPEKVLSLWGVPRGYLSKSFENFEGGDSLKNVCIEVSKKIKSAFIHGNTGSGKTHLAVAIMRHRVEIAKEILDSESPERAIFTSVPELLLEVRATYQKNSEATESDIIQIYQDVPLLVLDDMGSEKGTQWTESTLYLIIDSRDKDNMWTIITSNLSLAEIEQIHGSRIASRLSNMKIIHCKFPDYRRKRFNKGVK